MGFLAGMFSLLNVGIEKYRGEKDVGNYVAAASISGAVAGLTKGPKAGAQGMVAAGICGLAFGGMITGLEYVVEQQQQQEEQPGGGAGGAGGGGGAAAAAANTLKTTATANRSSESGIDAQKESGAAPPRKPWAEAMQRHERDANDLKWSKK